MLARLARIAFLVALLAGWQAALEHPIDHLSHEPTTQCDVVDALAACVPGAPAISAVVLAVSYKPSNRVGVPRAADAPPFHSQGPPIARV